MRFVYKTIDGDALRHNWRRIRKLSAAKKLLAVVKADAYGHGLLAVADALAALPDGWAVVNINDAIALRDRGIDKPIILLQGCYRREEIPLVRDYRLSPVVHSDWQVTALSSLPRTARLTVYLKINTGMNRLGFSPQDAPDVIETLTRTPAVADIVLMSHFANADAADGVAAPLAVFAPLRRYRLPVSLGNSGGCLLHGDINDDWGRVGIALYGASPAPSWHTRDELGLKPAMTLHSQIIATQDLAAGDAVGYGGEFIAPRPMRIGVVACGYGDGYPRASKAPVALGTQGTQRLPIVGRISMEMLTVDLSPAPTAAIGQPCILWGATPSVDEVAKSAGMIAYDLLTAGKLAASG